MTCPSPKHHFTGRDTCDCGYAELIREPGYTYIRQVDEPYPGYRKVLADRVKAKVAQQIESRFLSRS